MVVETHITDSTSFEEQGSLVDLSLILTDNEDFRVDQAKFEDHVESYVFVNRLTNVEEMADLCFCLLFLFLVLLYRYIQ